MTTESEPDMHLHLMLDSAEIGGGNLLSLNIASHWARGGHPLTVWAGGTGPAHAECERRQLPCRSYPQARLRGRGVATYWHYARLAWPLRHPRGLVHATSTQVYGLIRRLVPWVGNTSLAHIQIEEPPEAFRWSFAQPPTVIVTCAKFLADRVLTAFEGRAPCPIIALSNSVDTTKFQTGQRAEARQAIGAKLDVPLFVMLANLAPHKGQRTAIRAVARLRDWGLTTHLWLAGVERGTGGTFTSELEQLIRELNLNDCVRLLGQRDDSVTLLQAADALLLPSTSEGLPLSLLEAQACGVPVLAAPIAGVPEIIRDGETGFLVAADDAEGYAHRLRSLLTEPALREQLVKQALITVERDHSWSRYLQRWDEIYTLIAQHDQQALWALSCGRHSA